MSKNLTGARLAGGLPSRGREEHDFYATNPQAVERLLETGLFELTSARFALEPCAGMGHIADVLKRNSLLTATMDIVQRDYPLNAVADYLTYDDTILKDKVDYVITNPPFSLAVPFIEKSLRIVKDGGLVAMFLKLAFLETKGRLPFFEKNPPKYVYVFSDRMNTFRGGRKFDENGKPWATTMATAWFIWEKGFKGEPTIRWL